MRHQRSQSSCVTLAFIGVWHPFATLLPTVLYFIDLVEVQVAEKYQHARVKQWLKLLGRVYPQADACFEHGKRLNTLQELRFLVAHSH